MNTSSAAIRLAASTTVALAAIAMAQPAAARTDEGMWTFDAFPTQRMAADYGWAPDQKWLDRVRGAAVRLTGGCSASFVSPEGLILTNHHCVISCLQNLSTADSDLVAGGFNAADRARERKCPGQQAEVVTGISDVTPAIRAAIGTATGEALTKARDARIAEIEAAACTDRETTRCQVVALYGGGQYKLYRYEKYDDVRIAWAPEFAAAFFGGDPDNFNFPRYAMDAAFLRAYRGGKPVATPGHLKWAARAPVDGEATFVVGNPGTTRRMLTETQRRFQRELALPTNLVLLSEYRGRVTQAMTGSADKAREAGDTLFGIENTLKSQLGQFRSLNDPEFTAVMARAEADLRKRAAGNAAIGDPWGEIDRADAAYRDIYLPSRFVGGIGGFSDLYSYAETLVRAAAEREKPNAERLPGFTDSALPLLEKRLMDETPTYPWLEELGLAFSLSKMREYLGADDADVRRILGRESPEAMATRLVSGTTLADAAARRALWEGGAAAIAASTDPMIVLARNNDARSRALRQQFLAVYDGPVTAAQARLAAARFAVYGDANYPDATFTLRISYGKVAGWTERGQPVPTRTLLGGTFDRATGSAPFVLARGFEAARDRIDPKLTYNFVTTNDIIGGNSGSPVIDRKGEVIGTAFDGNIHSLGGTFGYDGTRNRTVVVSTEAVQEALETIYPAPALVRELAGGKGRRGR